MPLIYQQHINDITRLALWKITEPESFFLRVVPLQREITHPQKRLQHLAGRYLLPSLFPDFPKNDIAVAHTRKPYLPNEQYHFSISHCGAYAAAIVSTVHRVGIDAELITPRVNNIKNKFLHPDELRFVNNYPQQQRILALSILWSAKESIYKWYGLGEVDFSEMMRVFPFQIRDDGMLDAAFLKGAYQQKLHLHYKILGTLCMVWVVS